MSRPDGPEPSSASPEIAVSAAPTAPPKGASGRLSRSGYAILGVSGLVVATAFAAVAELAGPGSVTDTATNTTGGGQGGLQGSSQVVVPGNAVPGGPMTVPGSPTPGQTAPPTPTTVVAVGPDGKPTTSVITPPPNAGQPGGQPGGNPVPGTTSDRSDPPTSHPTTSPSSSTQPTTPSTPPTTDTSPPESPPPSSGSSSTGGQPSSTPSASTSDTHPSSSASR
ncbi:hypothetical protein G3I59_35060 [Amycolatopsis rubida]|uniref:Uncharacterized protein n=1 Tax=Amycolatopsis rubida TaxID=112413 RepID=A0A1I6BC67_9PSEU|nr:MULTISPECIES: hypothetical protein [Amycolatopsis]MYW95682.1 hypothetical protein [Amycolatopsis rubida]NEC60671.1 hypothetical protein [Amycolatopsis rubida]OAP22382.1 hypothetical protein A4R44_06832 [Amycolatopsis sp. M39]SFQ78367.1 hypothetical protein SAMN05421854_12529 [Amycolatopsis rubida]